MRVLKMLATGALLLGLAVPVWGQYPSRPYQRPYYPQRPLQQRYAPPSLPYEEELPSLEGPAPQQDGRHLWSYGSRGEGSFRQLRDGTWVESNYSGQYHYQELGRSPQFVDLYDSTRHAFVRLTDGIMYSHGLGDRVWHRGYTGRWE